MTKWTNSRLLLALVAFAASLALLPPSPGLAQKSPEKIRLDHDDKKGVLLVKIDKDVARTDLRMVKAGKTGFGSRVYVIPGKEYGEGEYYVARTLTPFTYHITSIWQQKRFGILFEPGPIEVDIKPGVVTYLGKVNSKQLLQSMRADAAQKGKTSVKLGGGFLSADGLGVVELTARDDESVAQAREFAVAKMKITEDQFEIAEVDPKFLVSD